MRLGKDRNFSRFWKRGSCRDRLTFGMKTELGPSNHLQNLEYKIGEVKRRDKSEEIERRDRERVRENGEQLLVSKRDASDFFLLDQL